MARGRISPKEIQQEAQVAPVVSRVRPEPTAAETDRIWVDYMHETNGDREQYDNAVDAARVARDSAYNKARDDHNAAVSYADKSFDEAVTAAWKTYMTITEASRHDRDERLAEVRHDLTRDEMHHAVAMAQSAIVEESGYGVYSHEDSTELMGLGPAGSDDVVLHDSLPARTDSVVTDDVESGEAGE